MRTPEDIAADRQALIERHTPSLQRNPPEATTHIRMDELATLCGIDIVALQAATPPEHADSPELREATDRVAKAKARIAAAEADRLEREAEKAEAHGAPTTPDSARKPMAAPQSAPVEAKAQSAPQPKQESKK